MAAPTLPVLRGRSSECAALDRLLDGGRDGHSGVLVIRGEAGVGKSALLGHVTRQARGFRLAQVEGVEAEMELPFAGLHQLCAPMLDHLDALPQHQRAALGIALGLEGGAAPDRFLVALGALGLLTAGAEEEPLLCVIDDAQWLDASTREVLGFAARRLAADPVVVVFAVRDPLPAPELAGLPELELTGLADDDAHGLLSAVAPGPLDEGVRERIVA